MPYTAITHDSRHPFETYILAAAVIGGTFAVFGNLWPMSIAAVFPFWAQTVWGIFFGGGAGIALLGIAIKRRDLGVFMEQIGLVAFAGACSTYAAALFTYNRFESFTVAMLMILLACASITQYVRLEKAVRAVIKRGQAISRVRRNG